MEGTSTFGREEYCMIKGLPQTKGWKRKFVLINQTLHQLHIHNEKEDIKKNSPPEYALQLTGALLGMISF